MSNTNLNKSNKKDLFESKEKIRKNSSFKENQNQLGSGGGLKKSIIFQLDGHLSANADKTVESLVKVSNFSLFGGNSSNQKRSGIINSL